MSGNNQRRRPEREVFVALCADYTQRQIATMFGVSLVAVYHWQNYYDCKPRPARKLIRPPRARSFATEDTAPPGPARLTYWAQPNHLVSS